MSRERVKLPPPESELAQLVESFCDGTIGPAERDRLEALLAGDREARLFYLAYLDVHARAIWHMRGRSGNDECGMMNDESCRATPQPVVAPIHHSSFIIHLSSLYAYAATFLLLAVAAAAAWAWQATAPAGLARGIGADGAPAWHFLADRPVWRYEAVAAPRSGVAVGTVTQVTGGEWGDQVRVGTEIPLGSSFAFTDGLVEITYSSGARVMLQGPVIFYVDAPNGGFLLLGKIGALAVNQRGESAGQRRGIPAGQSFCVRTPSSIASSRGAEISLRTERTGTSRLCLFRGGVYLESPHCEETLSLRQGSWAISEIQADGTGLVTYSTGAPPADVASRMPWRQQEAYSTDDIRAKRQYGLPADGRRKGREERAGG